MRLQYLASTWVLNLEGKQEALILYLKSVAVFGSFYFIHDNNYVFTAVLKLPSEVSSFSCLLYFIKGKRTMMGGKKNPVSIFFSQGGVILGARIIKER